MSVDLFAEIPDEPAGRSVVLDRTGVAFQRVGLGGRRTAWVGADVTGVMLVPGDTAMDWPNLLIKRGPVRLIWDGATDAPPPAPDLESALRAERASPPFDHDARTQPGGLAEPLTW